MAGWMINCKEYAELTSRSMDQRLSFWSRVSMGIHQWVCPPCKLIRIQFDTIRSACRFTPDDKHCSESDFRLTDEQCERMKVAVRKAAKEKIR